MTIHCFLLIWIVNYGEQFGNLMVLFMFIYIRDYTGKALTKVCFISNLICTFHVLGLKFSETFGAFL